MHADEDDLRNVIPLKLVKVSASAVTFHLRPAIDRTGWALATVNNDTGELGIQSDFGNWSYRWNVNHLGRVGSSGERATLMEFLADRNEGHCDYLADKLTTRSARDVFDAELSVRALRETLISNRLEQGRSVIDYYADEDLEDRLDVGGDWHDRGGIYESREVWICGRHERWPLTKSAARALYDKLDDLTSCNTVDEFCRRYSEIHGIEWITSEPYHDHLRHRADVTYLQLLHGILPAVVAAAKAHLAPASPAETPPSTPPAEEPPAAAPTTTTSPPPARHQCQLRMMREDGAGHWRDFHRGHNCHLDPNLTPHLDPTPQNGTV